MARLVFQALACYCHFALTLARVQLANQVEVNDASGSDSYSASATVVSLEDDAVALLKNLTALAVLKNFTHLPSNATAKQEQHMVQTIEEQVRNVQASFQKVKDNAAQEKMPAETAR